VSCTAKTNLQPVGDVIIDLADQDDAVVEDINGLIGLQRGLAQSN